MSSPRSRNWSCHIYTVVQPLLRLVRGSRWVIKRVFGVRVPSKCQVQFDPVTVLLAKSLPTLLDEIAMGVNSEKKSVRILEMGIGEGALVTLSLAHWNRKQAHSNRKQDDRLDLQFDGVDCSPSRLASSIEVAEYNESECQFWLSDLFESVLASPLYDLLFFNPPYVPTQTGRSLKLTERLRIDGDQMWDGGDDGTRVLQRFLAEGPRFLAPKGLIAFGVQPIFVSDRTVAEVVANAGLSIHQRFKRKGIPAVVYAVKPN